MKENFFNLFRENPTLITHCPVCNQRFNPLQAKVLEEGEGAHLIIISCRHCQACILALIMANNLGVSSIGLVSDLNGDEVMKFRQQAPISADEVLEAYQFISKEKVLINHLD